VDQVVVELVQTYLLVIMEQLDQLILAVVEVEVQILVQVELEVQGLL
jgi:hypothetical protein